MIIQTSLNIKDRGEVTLSLFPEEDNEKCKNFALVEKIEDKDNPYIRFTLENDGLKKIAERDIDETEESLKKILDDLYLDIVAAQKQGEIIEFEELSSEDKPYDADSIRIDSKSFSLRQILELVYDGDLDLMPEFQRNRVWDKKRKSRLIESILLRIPLPVFYFSEDEEGRYTVVDGLQRLSTICDFMQNKLKLENLEYLDENCRGKTYNQEANKIEDKFFRRFNAYQIAVNIISSDSPARVKYDIFKRLNTGGMPLNLQEIRNSFACQKLRDLLKKMVSLESFKKATGNLADIRMQAQEFALRYVLFFNMQRTNGNVDSYSGIMDDELDNCVEKINAIKNFDFDYYLQNFDCAMKNAFYLFGRHSFRKVRANTINQSNRLIVNKLLFESWSVVLSQYDVGFILENFDENSFIQILGKELDADAEYYKYVSYGTNGKMNVLYAFQKALEIMNRFLGEKNETTSYRKV